MTTETNAAALREKCFDASNALLPAPVLPMRVLYALEPLIQAIAELQGAKGAVLTEYVANAQMTAHEKAIHNAAKLQGLAGNMELLEAVLTERERCAKLAENWATRQNDIRSAALEMLAEQIRKG